MFTPSRGRILIFLFVLSMASVPLGSTRASAGTITTGVESYSASAPPATPAPYRVAVQIGHYKNSELPEALSRLSGHTGAYGGGRSEVGLNYDVAQRLAAILRGKGVVVDILPATIQTGYTADAFVAVHADGNSSAAARGFKISTRWRSQVALQDGRLVEMLTDSYRGATGLPEDSNVTRNMRGYYSYASWRPNYRISNLTPGAIVEMGFMTNAADRQVMFKATDKVASGIAGGLMNFLQWAYGSPRGTRTYGYGHVDSHIDLNAPAFPAPTSGPRMSAQTGDWQVLLMSSKPTVNIYDKPGGGVVIATLLRDQFLHSTMRKGDYYRVSLPGGKEGWVHRNAAVVQM
ncbi:MAG: N-acetylmuramoyl-L-alanine amidase [Chloroflexia bacterium]